ncbi:MAG TPA: GNAT family N-acetyltransferase [Gaiellaceae bacterium]|nr:GNAT family N-acetyltransferase [Gaiellaceae bacterium]
MGAERGRPRSAPRIALADDVELVRRLFREYADGLGIDLSFQHFDEEVAALPEGYDALLVAWLGDKPAGCIGIRSLGGGICEMKRLFVRPTARGAGVGRALALASIEHARTLGYERMRLDNIPAKMGAAYELYKTLGFVEIDPYTVNPNEGVKFMELLL